MLDNYGAPLSMSRRWQQCGGRDLTVSRQHVVALGVFIVGTVLLISVYRPKPVAVSMTADDSPSTVRQFSKDCTLRGEVMDLDTYLQSVVADRNGPHSLGPFGAPKIIHRTWKDDDVPEKWTEGVAACKARNEDYLYCHWTDNQLQEYIESQHGWFLKTFQNYRYPIQRVDAVRYFLLYQYGGVYVDLDLACKLSFDAIFANYTPAVDVVLAETDPTGVTNAFMAAKQGTDFMHELMASLDKSNRWRVVPYATIMFSTGPMFVSNVYWDYAKPDYKQHTLPGDTLTHAPASSSTPTGGKSTFTVIPIDDYKTTYFHHLQGSSWHKWDAPIVKFLGRWLHVLQWLGIFAATAVGLLAAWLVVRKCRTRNRTVSYRTLTAS